MGSTDIARRTALITGASSGIGYEFAKLLARDHFDLVLVARDASRLERVADELRQSFGITAIVIPTDLSRPEAAAVIHRALQDKGIHINILVNNAGFNVYGPFWETDAQRELDMIQTNIVALTQLSKLLLPEMIEQRSGKILNLGSTGSFAPGPLNAVYCATKAYVLSLSEALAEELKGTGVTVTTLCPGATRTAFAERAQMIDTNIFQGKLLSAAEVAQAGYRALMRGDTSIVVGLANKLQVLSIRFAPRDVVARIGKRIMSRLEARHGGKEPLGAPTSGRTGERGSRG
ncbi:SDR family oxidoreductase [Mesorhizobium sp. M00.F.Ca.ET.216.01.1.1]|uniref:SDR family NAD(P)-dependent oxidoreductase n=1 Tax=Mesorhizobium sp. M00.F.Ca.ET.216.01.1.1 TaxID=2500528 RepID=UPI000FD8D9BE|nr:SDR family oxidoreductase [Mesorhizobium sp. M00.F.Ca.ET.216.01.1.1]TGQ32420.1 SDR family oxidoreductase [Mesorhizobium sp. M00.F.Ca.ET.216.01.1.1]TJW15586.1 MAG: SDR family NAD(P)-dependent oxidoreductase [Mesorhizobium sp.]